VTIDEIEWRNQPPRYMQRRYRYQYRLICQTIDAITDKEADGVTPFDEDTSQDFKRATFLRILSQLVDKIGPTTLRKRLNEMSRDGVLDADGPSKYKSERDWLVQWPEKLNDLR
jgi:hypothetical protein